MGGAQGARQGRVGGVAGRRGASNVAATKPAVRRSYAHGNGVRGKRQVGFWGGCENRGEKGRVRAERREGWGREGTEGAGGRERGEGARGRQRGAGGCGEASGRALIGAQHGRWGGGGCGCRAGRRKWARLAHACPRGGRQLAGGGCVPSRPPHLLAPLEWGRGGEGEGLAGATAREGPNRNATCDTADASSCAPHPAELWTEGRPKTRNRARGGGLQCRRCRHGRHQTPCPRHTHVTTNRANGTSIPSAAPKGACSIQHHVDGS